MHIRDICICLHTETPWLHQQQCKQWRWLCARSHVYALWTIHVTSTYTLIRNCLGACLALVLFIADQSACVMKVQTHDQVVGTISSTSAYGCAISHTSWQLIRARAVAASTSMIQQQVWPQARACTSCSIHVLFTEVRERYLLVSKASTR
jgi:hypothetical protein